VKISKNFSLGEVCKSDAASTGLDEICSITALIHQCIQPIRDAMGRPIRVNSCFRNLQTNRAIGSGDGSSHLAQNGFAAMDFEIMGFDNKELAREIIKILPSWSDLILEFYDEKIKDPLLRADSGWIHLSFNRSGENRNQIRRAFRKGKKIVYEPWDLS
jgi:zinc D-Ala-D-Ala carboxypeptidase